MPHAGISDGAGPEGDVGVASHCARCAQSLLNRRQFFLGGEPRCTRCAVLYPPMLRRSFYTALVVGTLLTAINQGNLLLDGHFPPAFWWKIPLTYCVPFCVATWGALGAATRRT